MAKQKKLTDEQLAKALYCQRRRGCDEFVTWDELIKGGERNWHYGAYLCWIRTAKMVRRLARAGKL